MRRSFGNTVQVVPTRTLFGRPSLQPAKVPRVRRSGRRFLDELVEVVAHPARVSSERTDQPLHNPALLPGSAATDRRIFWTLRRRPRGRLHLDDNVA